MNRGYLHFFYLEKPIFGGKNKLPCFFKVKQPVFNVTYSCTANRYCRNGKYVEC